jgi:hypothetical protein
MYLTDEAVTINWEISLTAIDGVVLRSSFDIILTLPDCTATYLTDPTTNYIAPVYTSTVNTKGNVTYSFTPVNPGLHKIELVTGTSSDYEGLSTHELYVVCEPGLQAAKIEAYAVNTCREITYCGQLPQTAAFSTTPWAVIDAVGRHQDLDKMVVVGYEGNRPDGLGQFRTDIGVLDLNTGVITLVGYDILPRASLAAKYPAIDCDRDTGIYVVGTLTSFGNEYPSWWSTDLVTWTKCTSPSDSFQQNLIIKYCNHNKIWWRLTSNNTYVSKNGKDFVLQNRYRLCSDVYSQFPSAYGYLDAQMNPFNNNITIFGANSSEIVHVNTNSQPVLTVPLPGTTALGEVYSSAGTYCPTWPFNGPATFRWYNIEPIVGNTPGIVCMSPDGHMMYSSDASLENATWEIFAERLDQPSSPPVLNEFTNPASVGLSGNSSTDVMLQWNGKWYVQGRIGVGLRNQLYRYDGTDPRGLPKGYGWVNITNAPEGPWLGPNDNLNLITAAFPKLRVADAPWAMVINNDDTPGSYVDYVAYDGFSYGL